MVATQSTLSVTDLVMDSGSDNLANFVRRTLQEKKLTLREVSERAAARGYEISHATVADIKNHPDRTFHLEKLVALAHGLGVSEDEIIKRALGTLENSEDVDVYKRRLCDQLYAWFRNSSPETQQYMERTIRSLLHSVETEEAHVKSS
jgi:transcriptional regulator with XRE-family HTH domain